MQDRRELFEESRLEKKLSCSLQDAASLVPAARPRQRNALGPKPSCSLQDFGGGVVGPVGAELVGCAPRLQGGSAGTAGDNPGGGRAISADCPGRLGGTRDRFQSCGGDNPVDAAVDSLGFYKRPAGDGTGRAERVAGNNDSGDCSSCGSESRWKPLIVSAKASAIRHGHSIGVRSGLE